MTPRPKLEDVPNVGYFGDLLDIIIGDRQNDFGLKYDIFMSTERRRLVPS